MTSRRISPCNPRRDSSTLFNRQRKMPAQPTLIARHVFFCDTFLRIQKTTRHCIPEIPWGRLCYTRQFITGKRERSSYSRGYLPLDFLENIALDIFALAVTPFLCANSSWGIIRKVCADKSDIGVTVCCVSHTIVMLKHRSFCIKC